MAAIRKRKNGSYEIRVSCGYGVDGKQHNQYRSYYPEPGMTPRQIEREVNKMAVLFEEECMRGQITSAIKFQRFAEPRSTPQRRVSTRIPPRLGAPSVYRRCPG